ncbi:unnamed protein product [Linum tenue]|nr:unnamed protein product [Linum tenue]
MLNNESIHEMYSRFTILINKLKGLGRTFLVKDLNRKFFQSLPKEWLPKRTAIEEARNLATLPINELIGSLLSHENVIKQVHQDDDKRKKTLAFQSRAVDYDSDNDLGRDFEKEFALVSKRFHRMLKYKNDQKRRFDDSRFTTNDRFKSSSHDRLPNQQTRTLDTGTSDREPQACYKCGKQGHIRANCPQTLKAKERAMKASWSDYETDEEPDQIDKEALMAFSSSSGHCSNSAQVGSSSPLEDTGKLSQDDDLWYLDSGYSHHMSGKQDIFSSLKFKRGGKVTFGDDSSGTIVGIGTIGKLPSPMIHDVLLVDGLKHNLLSISQLCSSGHNVIFETSRCLVKRSSDETVIFVGSRQNNMYVIDLRNLDAFNEYCFIASFHQELLWHRKLGHISLQKLAMLSKLKLVRGLPDLKEKSNFFCDTCISGKQT